MFRIGPLLMSVVTFFHVQMYVPSTLRTKLIDIRGILYWGQLQVCVFDAMSLAAVIQCN